MFLRESVPCCTLEKWNSSINIDMSFHREYIIHIVYEYEMACHPSRYMSWAILLLWKIFFFIYDLAMVIVNLLTVGIETYVHFLGLTRQRWYLTSGCNIQTSCEFFRERYLASVRMYRVPHWLGNHHHTVASLD